MSPVRVNEPEPFRPDLPQGLDEGFEVRVARRSLRDGEALVDPVRSRAELDRSGGGPPVAAIGEGLGAFDLDPNGKIPHRVDGLGGPQRKIPPADAVSGLDENRIQFELEARPEAGIAEVEEGFDPPEKAFSPHERERTSAALLPHAADEKRNPEEMVRMEVADPQAVELFPSRKLLPDPPRDKGSAIEQKRGLPGPHEEARVMGLPIEGLSRPEDAHGNGRSLARHADPSSFEPPILQHTRKPGRSFLRSQLSLTPPGGFLYLLGVYASESKPSPEKSHRTSLRLAPRAVSAGLLAAVLGAGPQASESVPWVSRIEVDLDVDPGKGTIRSKSSLRIEDVATGRLALRIAEPLAVEEVRSNGAEVEYRKAGGTLIVHGEPSKDGAMDLSVFMTGRPLHGKQLAVKPALAVLAPEDGWYPTAPHMWARATVRIRVPAGWTAIAPGRREAAEPGGSIVWRPLAPVRSLAVVAAPDLFLSEAPAAGTPVRLASPKGGPRAGVLAERLRDGLSWLSAALAPYPFDGFNLVLAPGFRGRARASGMIVVGTEQPIESKSDAVDLLSGQWFGERVAGDGAWIEAFAAWQAVIVCRDRGWPLPSETARLREAYFELRGPMDVPLRRAGWDTPPEILRGKGSAAPDMIRLVAGDRAFFDAVRELFARPIGPPLSLDAVRATFEKAAGRSLGRAFSDWFDQTGAPDFEATIRTLPSSTGGYRVDLSLVQLRGTYALPVEVVFEAPGQTHREVVEVESEKTTPFYVLPFEPRRVEVDPGGRIYRHGAPLANPGRQG